jgi:hypothetical protein
MELVIMISDRALLFLLVGPSVAVVVVTIAK